MPEPGGHSGGGDDSAERIRRHMSAVRAQLAHDADEVADATRTMTDWKAYVRRYPWLFVGGAAVIGYSLIPRRPATVTLDADALRHLAGRAPIPLAAHNPPQRSLFATLLSTVVTIGAQQAVRGIARVLTDLGSKTSDSGGPSDHGAPSNHGTGI